MNKHIKFWPALLLGMAMLLSVSFLFAEVPAVPEDIAWNVTSDILSWTSASNPGSFLVQIFKDGSETASVAINEIAGSERSYNVHDDLVALGTNASYTAKVLAYNGTESSESELSPANIKGMASLGIIADLEYGSNPIDFIFNRTSSTRFTMLPFTYNKSTLTYNYSTSYADSSLLFTFPASGQYQLMAEYHGSSTETTYTQSMVTGEVDIPLRVAASASGMDTSGNPNADTQNNVFTIVVNPGNTDFEQTYTLRFRRRAENLPNSITGITHAAYAFSAVVNGSNNTAATTNGDNLSSLQELRWSVNSLGGTAYFTGNQMTELSNGNITVTATLVNNSTIKATSTTYTLSGFSNWQPHLGIFEVRGKTDDLIGINPLFTSNPDDTGTYSCSIIDDYSTVKLKLMAPLDSQIYINGARVSSNGESTLRIGPTDPVTGPSAITYTIKVENAQGSKNYVLNFIREINPRLKYGRTTGNTPYLASGTGDVFGVNDPGTDKLTVQAWVRWTVDPSLSLQTIAGQLLLRKPLLPMVLLGCSGCSTIIRTPALNLP
ncbi:MAG: hypothetical protein M0R69_03465 [Candidatus Cloacimonetes bacterium]|jgi:hypothetical protein|nr:hypothetical protein [Candidatus Cloacimonadota bacterium]